MHEAEEDRAGSAENSLCVSAARLGASNVAAIVKAGAAKLGLEAAAFAGHSLRAGFVTSAVSARVGLEHFKAAVASRAIVMPRRSHAGTV